MKTRNDVIAHTISCDLTNKNLEYLSNVLKIENFDITIYA